MTFIFRKNPDTYYLVHSAQALSKAGIKTLTWLLGGAEKLQEAAVEGAFIGPRKEMITPWSTNAVEMTQNMGIKGIERIEEFLTKGEFDPMLHQRYQILNVDTLRIDPAPHGIQDVQDIKAYNVSEGLALNEAEVQYLEQVAQRLCRPLTDSEVFGFSQVNSEHCRHKIFNGTFVIDGKERKTSLFELIKRTVRQHRGQVVSAYQDNVAFIQGPRVEQFSPKTAHQPDFFAIKTINTVLSLKAETHNFPTTVEPFNGAATGTGGEIRDRMAGGTGSIPLAGTAVYMTAYPRVKPGKTWEENVKPRAWRYQSPMNLLIKASNGASDFGNKFGQPLICGSLLTFEHEESDITQAYDKVIMLAGGIGVAHQVHAQKKALRKGDKIIVMGGDNYRIGMGGGAVSSVNTGQLTHAIELNAIQRANPEMQKRVANVLRAMTESDDNPILSVHDHGAGGHLNCLSELLEETGGEIDISRLPLGDPTLSDKEIIGNESQERMGLAIDEKDIPLMRQVAERERAPYFVVGEVTDDQYFTMKKEDSPKAAIHWRLSDMLGTTPKMTLHDVTLHKKYRAVSEQTDFEQALKQTLRLEAVACKDWLTHKVDRSVTGRVATQQTCGEIQLPLNNVAVMALDFIGHQGVATSIGHAPIASIADPAKGSQLALTKALTNIVWAPLSLGLEGVSLSANWMWPAQTEGEKARLYEAVEALSQYAIALGVNIPTGKDSLSMTQQYPDGNKVDSPGTVVLSTVAEVSDITLTVSPDIKPVENTELIYIPLSDGSFSLDGSSFGQTQNAIGNAPPAAPQSQRLKAVFDAIQTLIKSGKIEAGHDVSAGGLITTLLEMHFPTLKSGADIDLSGIAHEATLFQLAFSESPALVIQAKVDGVRDTLQDIPHHILGAVNFNRTFSLKLGSHSLALDLNALRDIWFETSYLLDKHQTAPRAAEARFTHYKHQPLTYHLPKGWTGSLKDLGLNERNPTSPTAAIIREKGVNGDREMAYALYLAGFQVKDVHMTDLTLGREDLTDVHMIVFVGGFSNSDVLGSAKGWAGAFLYNERAHTVLKNFYARADTLSLGVCNGCQLMMKLGLLCSDQPPVAMRHNASGKFESSFLNVIIPEHHSVMLGGLAGARLGVWVAHGEGRFDLPRPEQEDYNICLKYAYHDYPGNPNGSAYDTAGICSKDGRHLGMMPHLERSIFFWNWAHAPEDKKRLSPWIKAFMNAKDWIGEGQR